MTCPFICPDMKVVFVVPRFYPYSGGYENYVLRLARHLHSCGHKVSVLTSNAFDLESFWLENFRTLPVGQESVGGVEVYRFPISHRKWIRRAGRLLAYLPSWRLKARFSTPSFRVRGIVEALRQMAPDVIHIGPLPYNRLMYEGLREGRRSDVRVITTPCTHFGEDGNDEVSQHYTQPYQVRLLNESDAVLAMTDMERRRLIELGVGAEKVSALGLGIDIADVTGGNAERFRARWKVQGPVVFHLGTKAPDKGTNSVVEAMKTLWDAGTDAWLVLAGSSVRAFDDYIQAQPKLPRLLNLGPVDDADKRDLLAAAALLVHPSRVESLGVVYLEAWANGKPVIAADTAVSREIIEPGKDGLLVPFGDTSTIASAIQRVLADPLTSERMGQAGRNKVFERFSWDLALSEISRVFCSVNEKCVTRSASPKVRQGSSARRF
jgi:glycosyltransferase involved in cell wall biosynthesis